MNIKSITIDNVRGFEHWTLEQAILPNRPNILVAPNGFGKSSIATAFASLSGNKIEVKKENKPNEIEALVSQLKIELTTGEQLIANSENNTISSMFDIYVVQSQLLPKATAQRFGKIVTAKASMNIKPTTIYKTIPHKCVFSYNLNRLRKLFGKSGKILPDISPLYSRVNFIKKVERKIDFHIFELQTFKKNISSVVSNISTLSKLNVSKIKQEIESMKLFETVCQDYIELSILIQNELNASSEVDAMLSAWQYIIVRSEMKGDFRKAIDYAEYKERRTQLDKTLDNLNPVRDRFDIKSKEDKRSLIIEWPKAHLISSGQRDIMVFVAKLMECEFQSRRNCILVIDEFFDYLDDANIIAFQYYISSLINSFKKEKRLIFPILLTHLDPNYLKHFCFNDKRMNVCYLKNFNCRISKAMKELVSKRENKNIKDNLDKYYFHYNPRNENVDISDDFSKLSLNVDWGTPVAFKKKIDRECRTYLLELDKYYDPLAVCFSVRQKIEELVYNQLHTEEEMDQFLSTHGTNEKLNYAQTQGVSFPETYHLLGIIYNHPLHISGETDISQPLGMKFDNPAIRNMIKHLWED